MSGAPGQPPSFAHRVVLTVFAVVLAGAVAFHLGVALLANTPDNVVKVKYRSQIHSYLSPEMQQQWSLFAPELPQHDIRLLTRLELQTSAGGHVVSDWVDVTETDLQELRHNPLPSRSRTPLRKGWSTVLRSHDVDGEATGPGGRVSQRLVTRIALPRLRAEVPEGATVRRIQFRSLTTEVAPPPWTNRATPQPVVRDFAWWDVRPEDAALAVEAGR
jgi:hypothetical protein